MKKIATHVIAIILSIIILESCVMTTVVAEIEETTGKYETPVSTKISVNNEGTLILKISNKASNTSLLIDSIEICNIQLKGSCNLSLQINYEETATTPPIKIPEQKFSLLNPDEFLNNNENVYFKINGAIISYFEDGNPYTIFEGAMYFSCNGNITPNKTSVIEFDIYDNCPLYCIINGQIEKVLNSIGFSVTINNWDTNN